MLLHMVSQNRPAQSFFVFFVTFFYFVIFPFSFFCFNQRQTPWEIRFSLAAHNSLQNCKYKYTVLYFQSMVIQLPCQMWASTAGANKNTLPGCTTWDNVIIFPQQTRLQWIEHNSYNFYVYYKEHEPHIIQSYILFLLT